MHFFALIREDGEVFGVLLDSPEGAEWLGGVCTSLAGIQNMNDLQEVEDKEEEVDSVRWSCSSTPKDVEMMVSWRSLCEEDDEETWSSNIRERLWERR
jgi:hypothetical protein